MNSFVHQSTGGHSKIRYDSSLIIALRIIWKGNIGDTAKTEMDGATFLALIKTAANGNEERFYDPFGMWEIEIAEIMILFLKVVA